MNPQPEFAISQGDDGRLAVLERLVAKMAVVATRLEVLEIGSYEGRSALAFSHFIARHCELGGAVMCVDPWRPYLSRDDVESNSTCRGMDEDLRSGAAFVRFSDNIRHAHGRAPIRYRIGTLREVINNFGPIERYGLIYIDGSHAYEDVKDDVMFTVPLLTPGGIVCGDDLERQLHECDEAYVEQNKNREYIDGFHPGVTLAVGRIFGKVWSEQGVWAMRKIGNHDWSFP